MNYTLTPIDACHYTIKVPMNQEEVAKQKNTFLLQKQKTVEIKGYRKGKVPLSVVEKVYGDQSKMQAVYSSAWGPIEQAVAKEKLRLIGYPKFTEIENVESATEITATLEVLPKYSLKDFKSYQFEKEKLEISKDDIEKVRESLLKSRTEVKSKAEGSMVANGDTAVINFEGTLADGTKPAEMYAQAYSLEVGADRFIPGFEAGVVGMKVGESKVLKLEFPKEYHVEKYAGALVEFKVDVTEIKEKILPLWNEDLWKQFGYESEQDFQDKTKERLSTQKQNEIETKLRNSIVDKFLSDNEWQVPPTLIEEQKRLLNEDMKKHLRDSRIKETQVLGYLNSMEKEIRAKAEKQVKTALLIENLAETLSLRVTDETLDKHFATMAEQNKISVEEIKNYYESVPKYLDNLKFHLLEETVFAEIKKSLKLE